MVFYAIIFIAYMKTAVCLKNIPGAPVPHAEVLDEILTRNLGPIYTKNAIFDFILGVSNETKDNKYLNDTDANLSMKVLDVDNVKKIVEIAKKKFEKVFYVPVKRLSRRDGANLFGLNDHNLYVVNKAREFMLHTIHMTKERINDTFHFRQKYQEQSSYLIGLLYGASAAIMTKIEMLTAQLNSFTFRTHFIWYLIMYEKILACNIDINNNVERIFIYQDDYAQIRGSKDSHPFLGSKHGKGRSKGVGGLPPHIAEAVLKHKQEQQKHMEMPKPPGK